MALRFFQDHMVIASVCGLLTLILAVRYPKFIFSIVLLAVILVVVYHGIMSMASSGTTVKDRLLDKQQKQIGEFR